MEATVVTGADVSVVVPAYDDPARLRVALESIAAQTVLPGEVVVADDGSTADLGAVVDEVAAAHPQLRFTFVPSAANTGSVGARLRGVAATSGSWIAACDHDDVWLPTKLERQLAYVEAWSEATPLLAVGTWGTNVDDRLRPLSMATTPGTTIAEYEERVRNGDVFYCIHSSVLFRRVDHDAVGGYDAEYGDANDDLWLLARLGRLGAVMNIPEPLVLFRKTIGSGQVARFDDQQAQADRLRDNQLRYRDGRPPLDHAGHLALQRQDPWRTRAGRRLRRVGLRHYRRGAVLLADGHRVEGGLRLALAAVLDPRRVRDGVVAAARSRRR